MVFAWCSLARCWRTSARRLTAHASTAAAVALVGVLQVPTWNRVHLCLPRALQVAYAPPAMRSHSRRCFLLQVERNRLGELRGGSANAPVSRGIHTFHDQNYKISFDYPANWTFTQKDHEISTFRLDARRRTGRPRCAP